MVAALGAGLHLEGVDNRRSRLSPLRYPKGGGGILDLRCSLTRAQAHKRPVGAARLGFLRSSPRTLEGAIGTTL